MRPSAFPLFAIIAVTLLLNSCAPGRQIFSPPPTSPSTSSPPVSRPAPLAVPQPYVAETGPAAGLYHDGVKALAAGQWDRAEMFLERALRIEPRNAHYWHTLARIKYGQGEYRQAAQFGLKSNSLAGGRQQLVERNNRLIEQAKGR